MEDILIYHLRLKGNFFFRKKKFQKITSVNFVGPDPRLLEIGAKWCTHWALKLKIKKNKGCQRAGSRGTALWPVPICQKIWHMGTKKIIKKEQKTFFYLKNSIKKWKRAVLFNKQCLGGYFDLSFKTKREFFFFFKKFQKITSVNFVGPDPRLLEIGAKWRTHWWALKLKIKKNKGCQRAGSRGTTLWPVPKCQKIWHMGTKKNHQKTAKNSFFLKQSLRKWKTADLIN